MSIDQLLEDAAARDLDITQVEREMRQERRLKSFISENPELILEAANSQYDRDNFTSHLSSLALGEPGAAKYLSEFLRQVAIDLLEEME